MFRALKIFLLWLMIATLPIQGVASIVKATCGPRHHAVSDVAATAEHSHANADADHSHAPNGMGTINAAAAMADDVGEISDSSSVPQAAYCSACATCCVGAVAPPPSVSLTPAFLTVEAAVLPSVVSFAGIIPAAPERPPRHLSA